MTIRRFRLSQEFLDSYKDREVQWGFTDENGNSLGEATYLRSYSRKKADGTKERWHETVQRVIEGMFTVQREHCRRNKLPWDYKKAQRTAQDAYDRMFQFKWLPPGRGIQNMGAAFVIDEWDGTPLQNPLHVDTPVYTREGWVPLGSLAGRDEVELLSTPFKYARDDVADKKEIGTRGMWVKASVSEVERQPSVKITVRDTSGNIREIVASENHRWFVTKDESRFGWKRVSSVELEEGDRLPSVKPGIQFHMERVGQQHGFFFGDGSRTDGEFRQFGDSMKVMHDLFGDQVNYKNRYAVVNGCPLAWGHLPEGEYLKDKKYVLGFLSGYFAADGCVNKDGSCVISSARKNELVEVSRLFNNVGIATSEVRLSSQSSNYAEYRELYALRIDKFDLFPDFFLKSEHRSRWLDLVGSKKKVKDKAIVLSVEPVGVQEVLCAVVPEFEQFVIDGFILTSNCAFTSTKGDFAEAMNFLMLASMNGVGVGLDVLGGDPKHPHMVKGTDGSEYEYVVPDTREGWAEALYLIIDAHLSGNPKPVFDYSQIRPKGAVIQRFGGTASGPEELKLLLEWIDDLFESRKGSLMTVTDVADIANKIGDCVVSGSSRRSAEILVGPQTDEYMDLKDWRVNPVRTAPKTGWAFMSNNSILATVGQNYDAAVRRTVENGEPGYVWLDVAKNYGRMKDGFDGKDKRIMGVNPCSFGGETIVHTTEGPKTIESLQDRPFWALVNGEAYYSPVGSYITGQKNLYRLKTEEGFETVITDNHEVLTPDGWVESGKLVPGDKIIVHDHYAAPFWTGGGGSWDEGYLLGNLVGDRTNGDQKSAQKIELSSSDFHRGYLRGLFDADGHVEDSEKGSSVRLGQSDLESLKAVQRMLARLGVYSRICDAKSGGGSELPDSNRESREHKTEDSYCLVITSSSIARFAEMVGFTHTAKSKKLAAVVQKRSFRDSKFVATFKSLDFERFDDVWDLSVSTKRAFDANGLYVHNSEQMLEDKEMCTLVSTFPTRHESIDDYLKTLKVAYLYGKTVTLLPTVFEKTNAVMARNRRIGLSQSGITTYIDTHGIAAWRDLCEAGYQEIKRLDNVYSEWLCIRPSIRMTTVKPEGTVSLLTGDSPGVHWNPASGHYIRRVTMADGVLLEELRRAGYKVEESAYSKGQFVVEFPVKSPFKRSEKDVPVWEKVAVASEAQEWWSDNGVSVTVSFDSGTEASSIPHILSLYEGKMKTLSFLPMDKKWTPVPFDEIVEEYERSREAKNEADRKRSKKLEKFMSDMTKIDTAFEPIPFSALSRKKYEELAAKRAQFPDAVYDQMPYEEISEERYEQMCENLFPILWDHVYADGEDVVAARFCSSDQCEMEELEFAMEDSGVLKKD